MRILHSDVTLIGAGPAGCFLSVLLARSGVQVTLLEQHPTFDREFRGNAFQPLVLKTLEQMGLGSLLDELDHQTVDLFEVREQGLPLLSLPIRDLPPPWNFAVITPQAPLLKRLVEEAGRYSNFRFLSGAPVHGVVLENGKVAGVMAQFQDQRWLIESRLVVAADGRFSTVRRDLGIGYSKNPQEFDFLWFDMPRVTARQDHLGLTLEEAGILVNLPKGGGVSQVGWVIPKGSFAKLRQEGMQRFYERVRSVDRDLGDALPQHLQNFDQCSLLDVKIGVADTWARDGMVLIGDAAHTASPIGAQGNKLAIEDAVLVHPLIVRALREGERPVPASCFREFTTARRAEVERLLGLQKIFGRLLLEVKRGPWLALRRKVMRWLDGSSFKKRLVARMALGPHAVDTACFDNVRNEDPAQVFHRVRIKNIVQETARARTLVLDIPAALKSLFAYRPGQFLTVRVLRKGVLAKRCYSLSSTPGVDPDPQITIKWILNGRVSTWLTKEVKAGDALWVLPPAGSFVHRPDASRPRRHVMFAAGSGITPLFSILKSVLKTEPQSRITLVYGNHDAAAAIFREALAALAAQEAGRFSLAPVYARLTQDAVRDHLSQVEALDPVDREFYVCGPEGMREAVVSVLKQKKVPPARIHLEKFVSLYDAVEQAAPADEGPSGVEVGDALTGGMEIPETVLIKINGQEHAVPIGKDETVLQAALRAGLPAPYSCESGVCATCTAKLMRGRVRMDHADALSEQDLKRHNILTCQAVQLTRDAFVDYDVL